MAAIVIKPIEQDPRVFRLFVGDNEAVAFTVKNKNSIAAILRAAARVAERAEYDAWISRVRGK